MPRLIGISGPRGAGKDLAGDYLQREKGFLHVSASDKLRQVADAIGADTTRRAVLGTLGREIRDETFGDILIQLALDDWLAERDRYLGGLVVTGHFALEEAQSIQANNGTMAVIVARRPIRFEREQSRRRDDMSELTIDEFAAQEAATIEGLAGPNTPNLRAVASLPGVIGIDNNGSEAALFAQLDRLAA